MCFYYASRLYGYAMAIDQVNASGRAIGELRQQFPHTKERLYVNHAATAPLSTPVVQAIDDFVAQRHLPPVENFERFAPVMAQTRRLTARLLSCTPARVEFVPNTSTALRFLAEGLDWKPGDRVVVPGCEFPANVYPLMNLGRHGVNVDFVPHREGSFSVADVERVLRDETRLLSVSWVQFLSGFRADIHALGELCRERDIIFCVDAIQGLGAFPLDVEANHIDYLACGGHKWLMATQGVGILYCSEALQEQIVPPAGWLHGPVDWENFFDYKLEFHADARRFRTGTVNGIGISALRAALELYHEAGPEWCARQIIHLTDVLWTGLRDLGLQRYGPTAADETAGIVTVRHPRVEAIHQHLQDNQIDAAVRNRLLRFAPSYYNTEGEMRRIVEAVAQFQGQR